jgi:hypothetical protein
VRWGPLESAGSLRAGEASGGDEGTSDS